MAADENAGLKLRRHRNVLEIPPRQGREGRDRFTRGTGKWGGCTALRHHPLNEAEMGAPNERETRLAKCRETAEVGSRDEGSISSVEEFNGQETRATWPNARSRFVRKFRILEIRCLICVAWKRSSTLVFIVSLETKLRSPK